MDTKRFSVPMSLKGLEDSGKVEAIFSTSDVIDHDGDRVLATAFKDGEPVPLCWSHDWSKIVGRGTVRRLPAAAKFSGRFFTETQAGKDAHATVKALAGLSEWSFGFTPLRWTKGASGERVIEDLKLHEVSVVLRGSNPNTSTTYISEKSAAGSALTLYEVQGPLAVPDRLRRAADAMAIEAQAALQFPFWLIPKWVVPAAAGASWRDPERQRVHGPSNVAAFYVKEYVGSLFLKVDSTLSPWQVGWAVCHEARHAYEYHAGLKPDELAADRFAYALMDSLQEEDHPWAR